jgi:hypothetical protein
MTDKIELGLISAETSVAMEYLAELAVNRWLIHSYEVPHQLPSLFSTEDLHDDITCLTERIHAHFTTRAIFCLSCKS